MRVRVRVRPHNVPTPIARGSTGWTGWSRDGALTRLRISRVEGRGACNEKERTRIANYVDKG